MEESGIAILAAVVESRSVPEIWAGEIRKLIAEWEENTGTAEQRAAAIARRASPV